MNVRLHREATYQDAQAEAAKLGPQFKAAAGYRQWEIIDTSAPMWHRLDDIELARIGLRRHELAPMRKPEDERRSA
ncbi:hypothetical protein [Ectopseudomonas oleovorans]|uniref:Uncharacterized protein n=1 Tax=Ectopseudomonas oleovorans TaxID=301 RepID=A0AA42QB46_ECTOL|nr:hypothetical protein [Pseudomonas oleovorans]MDH1340527.1 hypothetical protein [Pseudomonas oleovorans]MDH1494542.1 hypothetical protein [Pseudomonas oleovorans]WGG22374.1 hypothetical protein N5O83_06815 [Pseudomonas oleovorans]